MILQADARLSAVGAGASRFARPMRDALVVVGIGRALWFFFVQGIRPWEFAGVDARAYWQVDLAHPYVGSGVGDISTYLYSPAFAQLLAPLGALPFPVFFALWTAISIAILVWLVRPWPWAVPILALPIIYELCVGNVHFLMAAAIVLGFRWPVTWAFPILTKVTPAVGLGWFVVRREWRALAIAVGTTGAIVIVSFALDPTAWADWIAFLLASPGRSQLLLVRLVLAAALVALGAATGRRWLVPVAVWISLPIVWINSWVILLAVIRLGKRDVPVSLHGEAAMNSGPAPSTSPPVWAGVTPVSPLPARLVPGRRGPPAGRGRRPPMDFWFAPEGILPATRPRVPRAVPR